MTIRIPVPMAPPTAAPGGLVACSAAPGELVGCSAAPGELVGCTECGRCCTYVSVGINEPRTVRYASDILWYLYHEQVSVYRDGDGDWSVVFETRCRHLQGDLLCRIYPDRPLICREFDNTTCEVNSPEGGRTFAGPEEFLVWLRQDRPGLYRRLAARFVPAALRAADPPSPHAVARAGAATPAEGTGS